jgi:ubiquinone/menaquinone biosynthesis C-methylase UbiE
MDRLLEATARAERHHFWFRGFRAFVTPLVERAVDGRPAEILDCGAGTGHNLQWLSRFGRATGIDLTWSGLAYARAAGRTRLARASAAALPFSRASFDLVTSFDVLQCIPGEAEEMAVREMRRVLRPGGHLVITVAALNLLRGNHSVLSREVRRYSRKDLRRLLEAAGFDLLAVTYTNATLFPVVAAVRAAQRLSGLAASDADAAAAQEISIPPAPINALLGGLLSLEARVVRAVPMPFGSSLMALARTEASPELVVSPNN